MKAGLGRRGVVVATVAVLASALAGCTAAREAEVQAAAERFQQQVAVENWPAACELLSDTVRSQLESTAARSCVSALPALRLTAAAAGPAEVWGHNASVSVGDGRLFLSLFSSGWRVIGAGCTPSGEDLPYQCSVGG